MAQSNVAVYCWPFGALKKKIDLNLHQLGGNITVSQALMTRSEAELTTPFARFLSVGLGLLYLGRQDAVEATLEVHFQSCI